MAPEDAQHDLSGKHEDAEQAGDHQMFHVKLQQGLAFVVPAIARLVVDIHPVAQAGIEPQAALGGEAPAALPAQPVVKFSHAPTGTQFFFAACIGQRQRANHNSRDRLGAALISCRPAIGDDAVGRDFWRSVRCSARTGSGGDCCVAKCGSDKI